MVVVVLHLLLLCVIVVAVICVVCRCFAFVVVVVEREYSRVVVAGQNRMVFTLSIYPFFFFFFVEFGAMDNETNSISSINFLTAYADSYLQSWMYVSLIFLHTSGPLLLEPL